MDGLAREGIRAVYKEFPIVRYHPAHPSPHVRHLFLFHHPSDELLIAFPGRSDIHVEHISVPIRNLALEEKSVFGRVHTADTRTVRHPSLGIARANALDEDHLLWNFSIRRPAHLSSCGP